MSDQKRSNRTFGKVKLVKSGPGEVTLLFPKGTAARFRTYARVEDVMAVLRCPTSDVEGQGALPALDPPRPEGGIIVGCDSPDC